MGGDAGRTGGVLARFIAASGAANLADGVATVAWAWTASALTRDPLLIALVPVALRLPWAVLAVPAGIVTDRADRRRLILRMDALRAVAFAAAALALALALPLPAAPASGVSSPWLFAMIAGAALVVGGAEVFRDNAAQTMLPAIVPHDRLEVANGRLWSVEMVANALVGPALGAFLIAVAMPAPFAVNAGLYLLALAAVLSIAGRFRAVPGAAPDWRRELGEGVRFLAGAPLLRVLAIITGVWNLFFQMVAIALVLHVQENLGLGAPVYGLILGAGAVGGVLGGLAAGRVIGRLGAARTAQWSLAASALAFALIPLAPGAVALALVMAAFEFTGILWNTVSVSYRQRTIPDRLLGRVNSLYRLLAWGMMPVGLLASGLAVRVAATMMERGPALTAPFWLAAAGAAVLSALGWRALGRGFGPQG